MPDQPPMPALTVRAIRATPVEVPLNFVLGTSQGAVRQAPLLLIDLETEEGITGRSYLFCYLRAAAPAIMSLLGEVERVTKGEPVDAGRAVGQAGAPFHADRGAGHRAHGDVRLRCRLLGRARDCRQTAARAHARRRAEADPGLQQLRPRPDGRSRRARRRGRDSCSPAAFARSSCASAIRRLRAISPRCTRCASGSATMCI